jgi:hypothetical protein
MTNEEFRKMLVSMTYDQIVEMFDGMDQKVYLSGYGMRLFRDMNDKQKLAYIHSVKHPEPDPNWPTAEELAKEYYDDIRSIDE